MHKIICPQCKEPLEFSSKDVGICYSTNERFIACPNKLYNDRPCNAFIPLVKDGDNWVVDTKKTHN